VKSRETITKGAENMNSYEEKQEARKQRYEELAEKNRQAADQRHLNNAGRYAASQVTKTI
jgi:hypothetical protein